LDQQDLKLSKKLISSYKKRLEKEILDRSLKLRMPQNKFEEIINKFNKKVQTQFNLNKQLYEEMLEAGIAKECARFVLPLATPTRIYMTGSCRSWIHYINLRTGQGTQKEHMDIAKECKNIFSKEYPVVSSALNWLF